MAFPAGIDVDKIFHFIKPVRQGFIFDRKLVAFAKTTNRHQFIHRRNFQGEGMCVPEVCFTKFGKVDFAFNFYQSWLSHKQKSKHSLCLSRIKRLPINLFLYHLYGAVVASYSISSRNVLLIFTNTLSIRCPSMSMISI
jgi:hypothetical protein